MTTVPTDDHPLRRWLLPRDPRRLALAYLAASLLCLAAGGALALLLRAELLTPDTDLISAPAYNRAFTLHGLLLALVFVVPAIPAALGHAAVPHLLEGPDRTPWPGIAGLYLFLASALLLIVDTVVRPPDATTLATLAWLGLLGLGLSACLTALDHAVAVLRRRGPVAGELSMFVRAVLGGGAVLASALTLAALASGGGAPATELASLVTRTIPAITTIFAYGVVCEIFADHPHGLVGRRVIGAALALLVLAALPVWSLDPVASSIAELAGQIAAATLFCVWLISAFRGGYERATPRLFAAAVVATMPFIGAANAVSGALFVDVHLRDTYFTVARFHLEMDVVLLAFLGGLHLWWPQLTGRAEAGRAGSVGPVLLWAGMIVTAIAQFALGHQGMPRRYYTYLPEYEGLHELASLGAGLQALALVWIAARLARSLLSPKT